jgi:hypothetical protein
MKKILKISLLSFFITSSLFLGVQVLAFTPTESDEFILLASVNVQDAKIISQKENNFNISFYFNNGEGLQTGVKYSVQLIKQTDKDSFIVDEKIYDESLTLNPNTSTKKDITYSAPTFLEGDYFLKIVSNNTNGFPFGILDIGKVKLVATTMGIQILPETCYINVVGEKGNPSYTLTQGVDIKSEEDLSLNCTAFNSSKSDINTIPKYETHYRTNYGNVVDQIGGDTKMISFKANEQKPFTVILPKAIIPQAYNVNVYLDNGKVLSNPVSVHYVLRGASATIQSISLDKDYYIKGDTAKAYFVYSHSADSFQGSRFGSGADAVLTANIKISDTNNNSCAESITQTLSGISPKSEVSIPITVICVNPKISLSLTNDKGTVLDQKEFTVKTSSQDAPSNRNMLYIIIVIVLVIIVATYIIMKKKKFTQQSSIPMAVLFVLFALSVFIPTGKIHAVTFAVGPWHVTASTSESKYNPGDEIYLSGTIAEGDCANGISDGTIKANISGIPADQTFWQRVNNSFLTMDQTMTTPSSLAVGTNTMNFYATLKNSVGGATNSGSGSTTFTFAPLPTVTVYGNGSTSPTVPYGGSVNITWTSSNASSCTCSYGGTSCTPQGSGAGTGISASGNPYTITSSKTFTVTCDK